VSTGRPLVSVQVALESSYWWSAKPTTGVAGSAARGTPRHTTGALQGLNILRVEGRGRCASRAKGARKGGGGDAYVLKALPLCCVRSRPLRVALPDRTRLLPVSERRAGCDRVGPYRARSPCFPGVLRGWKPMGAPRLDRKPTQTPRGGQESRSDITPSDSIARSAVKMGKVPRSSRILLFFRKSA